MEDLTCKLRAAFDLGNPQSKNTPLQTTTKSNGSVCGAADPLAGRTVISKLGSLPDERGVCCYVDHLHAEADQGVQTEALHVGIEIKLEPDLRTDIRRPSRGKDGLRECIRSRADCWCAGRDKFAQEPTRRRWPVLFRTWTTSNPSWRSTFVVTKPAMPAPMTQTRPRDGTAMPEETSDRCPRVIGRVRESSVRMDQTSGRNGDTRFLLG